MPVYRPKAGISRTVNCRKRITCHQSYA